MSHCVEEQKEVGFDLDVEEKGKVESCVDDLFNKLTAQFNDSQSILKTLANNLKILHKEVLRERKEIAKNAKKTKKTKQKKLTLSGFAKPSLISPELAAFLGTEKDKMVARTDATKLVIAYVKEHNLQNPENKKQILPDEKLRKLLEPHFTSDDKLEYLSLIHI